MNWINEKNILVVGLGLIGGSYARALSRIGYGINAIDINEESIKYALEEGIIKAGDTSDSEKLISDADVIIIALYPTKVPGWILKNQSLFKKGAMITDVTGVKTPIVYEIQENLREDVEFIAAHPMAGREVYGVKNSDDKIFRNANFIVVPTEKNTPEAITWCERLGRIIGCSRVSVLTPEEHDSMIAYVSQLTHCIAVALMTCENNEHIKDYTGDSFRDLTRIANINENMWSELFFMNKDALLERIDSFIGEMTEIRTMIETEDEENLKDKMKLSTERRARFNKE